MLAQFQHTQSLLLPEDSIECNRVCHHDGPDVRNVTTEVTTDVKIKSSEKRHKPALVLEIVDCDRTGFLALESFIEDFDFASLP